jgi:hypothetical protein
MSTKILITPKTAAETSDSFSVNFNHIGFLTADGLATTETVTIQIYCPASQTWTNYKANNTVFQLTSNTNGLDIYLSAGTYRVVKGATVATVGVALQTSKVEV